MRNEIHLLTIENRCDKLVSLPFPLEIMMLKYIYWLESEAASMEVIG